MAIEGLRVFIDPHAGLHEGVPISLNQVSVEIKEGQFFVDAEGDNLAKEVFQVVEGVRKSTGYVLSFILTGKHTNALTVRRKK